MKITLNRMSNEELKTIWSKVKPSVKFEFSEADFSENYTADLVINEIENEIKNKNPLTVHLLAYDERKSLVGAAFSILTEIDKENSSSNVGWIYTVSSISPYKRIKLFMELVTNIHHLVRNAGFKKIISEIGTKRGQRLLKEKFGYKQICINGVNNMWLKILDE